jgi:hypothetical protein
MKKKPTHKGLKFDDDKIPLDLIPYEAEEEIGKVLLAGAKKYKRANWANGLEISRLIAAAKRHIGQFNKGIDKDSETDTLHIANAAVNLIFAIWMFYNRPDLDDRWILTIKKRNKNENKTKTSRRNVKKSKSNSSKRSKVLESRRKK